MPSIADQSILIIGGSSGIGLGVAHLALAQKSRVFISSSNQSRISGAIESLRKLYPDGAIEGFPCDLKSADVESNLEKLLIEVITANNGELLNHVVFTAADSLPIKPLSEVDLYFIRSAGQIRFMAPLLLGKLAPRFIKPSYESSITLTSGTVARKPVLQWPVISGYMSGLEGVTKSLALELKPIRVNLVMPGAVDTELWGKGETRRATVEMMKSMTFQGRVALADEIAEAYIYIMRDTNVNGATLNTDGGEALH
ncbi:short-chain dehydrogenase [Talaromyces proteolyticus]|uniref:Short-chain dehydrogenase n=1 Tax=Talaromyces proteolyticus TaxID=1131652 RepID=A0AAD4KTY1_9EURO|nr:short-chain dehydrogenase [Talaromyces proteolyticus]KAH8699212.1 short-chain dehydrogenase [Talaromyces proteolyticus]